MMLPVSLYCPLLISPSVFSNVYLKGSNTYIYVFVKHVFVKLAKKSDLVFAVHFFFFNFPKPCEMQMLMIYREIN